MKEKYNSREAIDYECALKIKDIFDLYKKGQSFSKCFFLLMDILENWEIERWKWKKLHTK